MSKRIKKNKIINTAFQRLANVYKSIPDTKGCMDNINKPKEEGGCGAWCCQFQNPHVLHIEFLNTWRHVLRSWDWTQVADLIERAMRNYLSERPTKGCIFFNKESKLCTIHETRPFNCRVYGITPEEEMKPRIERLKVLYKGRLDAVVRDQCNLVSTVNDTKVTTDMTSKWWKQLVEIEEFAGTKKKDIHDRGGGSYMTFHDHILLHVFPDVILKQLQILRLHGEKQEKETAILGIMAGFRNKVKTLMENAGKEEDESETEEESPTSQASESSSSISAESNPNEGMPPGPHVGGGRVIDGCAGDKQPEAPGGDAPPETPSV